MEPSAVAILDNCVLPKDVSYTEGNRNLANTDYPSQRLN